MRSSGGNPSEPRTCSVFWFEVKKTPGTISWRLFYCLLPAARYKASTTKKPSDPLAWYKGIRINPLQEA